MRLRSSPFHFQRLFTRWAGASRKKFIGYLMRDHAKRALDRADSIIDAAYDADFPTRPNYSAC